MRVDQSWRDLLAQLDADPSWQSIFVVGSTDSGKTTLCRFLGAQLARRCPTAAVDCDPGQSALGPPACLALAWEPWDGGSPSALRFVGATTPQGHFLQTLASIKLLAERAGADGAQKLVFDSSGYANTDAMREFFFQTLDLIRPDHLVALQRSRELEPLLASFARRQKPRLHRLPISPVAGLRNRATRRAYRQARFQQYFASAAPQSLPIEGLGFHGMLPPLNDPGSHINRLIALCDWRGFAAVLGIIEAVDFDAARLQLYAPPFEREQIASLQYGALRLDRSGREF